MDIARERAVRQAAMDWLEARTSQHVDYAWLTTFEYGGERVPLIDRQRGIRKPNAMNSALAIRTTYTDPRATPPYADTIGLDGLQRYKYRGTDPMHPENVSLREAMRLNMPLIWFVGVGKGLYEPIYPVWVVGDEPESLQFALAVAPEQRLMKPGELDLDMRRYAERITKQRLHQRVFRTQVLLAYEGKCCICRLKHVELLDAAHIIDDGMANGEPVVPNGLSLCKIHHAAFDNKILAVRPDLSLHVRQDVLEEVDGWMLKGGIQAVHNKSLEVIPATKRSRPDPVRLEERYSRFLAS